MDVDGSGSSPELAMVEDLFPIILSDEYPLAPNLAVTAEDDGEIEELLQILSQTSSVKFYSVACSSGAIATFRLPVTAFGWHARFGFFRADGSRISLTGIIDYQRSYYAGSVLKAQCTGRLPAGTKDLRTFWWYGSRQDGTIGEIWWNRIGINC